MVARIKPKVTDMQNTPEVLIATDSENGRWLKRIGKAIDRMTEDRADELALAISDFVEAGRIPANEKIEVIERALKLIRYGRIVEPKQHHMDAYIDALAHAIRYAEQSETYGSEEMAEMLVAPIAAYLQLNEEDRKMLEKRVHPLAMRWIMREPA